MAVDEVKIAPETISNAVSFLIKTLQNYEERTECHGSNVTYIAMRVLCKIIEAARPGLKNLIDPQLEKNVLIMDVDDVDETTH